MCDTATSDVRHRLKRCATPPQAMCDCHKRCATPPQAMERHNHKRCATATSDGATPPQAMCDTTSRDVRLPQVMERHHHKRCATPPQEMCDCHNDVRHHLKRCATATSDGATPPQAMCDTTSRDVRLPQVMERHHHKRCATPPQEMCDCHNDVRHHLKRCATATSDGATPPQAMCDTTSRDVRLPQVMERHHHKRCATPPQEMCDCHNDVRHHLKRCATATSDGATPPQAMCDTTTSDVRHRHKCNLILFRNLVVVPTDMDTVTTVYFITCCLKRRQIKSNCWARGVDGGLKHNSHLQTILVPAALVYFKIYQRAMYKLVIKVQLMLICH
ncbi:hypothetical protein J6590_099296 [Homalodisca vitripennis]|nr:hypothetical protein J6590_099296 [Homalodisca vitripennis]